MSKARRIETLNAEFVDGYASGWCFGVHEAFRANLDIRLDVRVDRAANEALAAQLGRRPTAAERITRQIWTQGSPASYSFDRGHMMHEPAEVHRMPWAQALPLLRRSIVVLDARSDAGALPAAADEDETEAVQARDTQTARQAFRKADVLMAPDAAQVPDADALAASADSSKGSGNGGSGNGNGSGNGSGNGNGSGSGNGNGNGNGNGEGWVEFALYRHPLGEGARPETHRLSQADFVQLLKTGAFPDA